MAIAIAAVAAGMAAAPASAGPPAADPVANAAADPTANIGTPDSPLYLDRSKADPVLPEVAAANASKGVTVDDIPGTAEYIRVHGRKNLPKVTSSGHRPYGGDGYGVLRLDGLIGGCSAGIATRSSTGAQYVYTAGHCMLNSTTGAAEVSSTSGKFWTPFNACPTCQAPFGDTGYAGAYDSSTGDWAFIRANRAQTLYREVRSYTGAIYVVPAGGNPLPDENAAMVASWNGHTIHGYVSNPGPLTIEYDTGRSVANQAVMVADADKEGCTTNGDSGGAMLSSPSQQFIGTVSGDALVDYGTYTRCYTYFDRAGTTMSRKGQVFAPAPPA